MTNQEIIKKAVKFFELESNKTSAKVVDQIKEYGAIKVLAEDNTQLVFQVVNNELKPIRLRGKGINKKYNSVQK